jgi:hypothetical protein
LRVQDHPLISQCPVVVSLPADRSAIRATTAAAGSLAGTPAISVSRPNPHDLEAVRRDPGLLDAPAAPSGASRDG